MHICNNWRQEVSKFLQESENPLIVILGPTASGKTSFSIEVAHHIGNAEVVNADSRQLYRKMDIGTAKITEEEMEGVKHHLFDVLDPNEEVTAGWYQVEATKEIDSVLERGNIPLLVGGSMLYISSIVDGLSMAPESDPELRKKLIEEYETDDGVSLYARLMEVDPETAETTHPNNQPRLVRAMEIYELCQRPKSEAVPKDELRESSDGCKYDVLMLGMLWDREELIERINQRAQIMFDAGWIKEVQFLLDAGYIADDPAMKSTGYREIIRYIQDDQPEPLDELKEVISAKTRQYARRQMTWWKPDQRIKWIQNPRT